MISKAIITFSFLTLTQPVFAGGSVIGNGAGLVESEFQYVYSDLSEVIEPCMTAQNYCSLNEKEIFLLTQIDAVLEKNKDNPQRLIFISAEKNPGFFDTSVNEPHRLAKTGSTSEAPIYINTDLLYTSSGRPAIDSAFIVAILIHELGHQVGETEHTYLDIIGAKIKKLYTQKMDSYNIAFGSPIKHVDILFVSKNKKNQKTDFYISWNNFGVKNFSDQLSKSLSCSDLNSQMVGYKFYNGYFELISKDLDSAESIGFGLWSDVLCQSKATSEINIEKVNLKLQLDSDMSVKVLSLIKL